MGAAIGEILPYAVGIAISPIPIAAAVLMLLSPRATRTSVPFLVGWVLGIALAVTVLTLVASVLPQNDPAQAKPVAGTIKVVLGIGLLLLALRQWRGRPARGTEPVMPAWMGAIGSMTPGRALTIGLLLSGLNPKNLLMSAAAGVVLGSAGLPAGQTAIAIAVLTVLAASTVGVPVVAHLLAADRMGRPLEALRHWLVSNNATVMTVLLLVIGIVLVGRGIASF